MSVLEDKTATRWKEELIVVRGGIGGAGSFSQGAAREQGVPVSGDTSGWKFTVVCQTRNTVYTSQLPIKYVCPSTALWFWDLWDSWAASLRMNQNVPQKYKTTNVVRRTAQQEPSRSQSQRGPLRTTQWPSQSIWKSNTLWWEELQHDPKQN